MSSRVGTAIPVNRSTALSSSAVGLTRSIQTAPSGKSFRSPTAAFFSEESEGTNTENMDSSAREGQINQRHLAQFSQSFVKGISALPRFPASDGGNFDGIHRINLRYCRRTPG